MEINILTWFIENKVAVLEAYFAIVGAASLLIRLTPTVRDDLWLKKYLKFVGKIIALNRK